MNLSGLFSACFVCVCKQQEYVSWRPWVLILRVLTLAWFCVIAVTDLKKKKKLILYWRAWTITFLPSSLVVPPIPSFQGKPLKKITFTLLSAIRQKQLTGWILGWLTCRNKGLQTAMMMMVSCLPSTVFFFCTSFFHSSFCVCVMFMCVYYVCHCSSADDFVYCFQIWGIWCWWWECNALLSIPL